jgi:hypothetical protein
MFHILRPRLQRRGTGKRFNVPTRTSMRALMQLASIVDVCHRVWYGKRVQLDSWQLLARCGGMGKGGDRQLGEPAQAIIPR